MSNMQVIDEKIWQIEDDESAHGSFSNGPGLHLHSVWL